VSTAPTQLPFSGGAISSAETSDRPRPAWRRFLAIFLLVQAVLMGSIAALSYVVNPLGIYPTHWFSPMVWNGRGEKVAALSTENPKPQILIFGSSRVWTIAPAKLTELTGMPSFNAGVSVAMTEDYYALLRYAVEQARIEPKLVIIGLDVEALHNTRPVDSRSQDVPELRPYLPGGGLDAAESRLKSLVTAQSVQLSIRSLHLANRGKSDTPPDPLYTVGPHGDTRMAGMERRIANGESSRAKELHDEIPTFQKRYDNYTALSPVRLDYLRRTLEYCAQRHIKAIVYITPMSKGMQAALESRGYPARLQDILNQVPPLAKANGAAFVDYSNTESFGGSEDAFLDGIHRDQSAGAIMVTRLLKDTGITP
jgi:hypothetical protein